MKLRLRSLQSSFIAGPESVVFTLVGSGGSLLSHNSLFCQRAWRKHGFISINSASLFTCRYSKTVILINEYQSCVSWKTYSVSQIGIVQIRFTAFYYFTFPFPTSFAMPTYLLCTYVSA